MPIISAADGCPSGWVVISQDLSSNVLSWRLADDAHGLILARPAPEVLTIDIPIGLPERGARTCDCQARGLLGPGRGSSVFPAPVRPVLAAESYAEACRIRSGIEGKKMSKQAWNIVGKIRQVDLVLSGDPVLRRRVHEVHPEVCFYFMAGGHRLSHGKKSSEGRAERLGLLEGHFGAAPQAALGDKRALDARPDDILDAFAALWTARRIVAGVSRSLPVDPPRDASGLSMEIVY